MDYIDFTYQKDPNAGITYKSHDELFHDSIPNFESELLQIIATSDQQTIDTYFESLWLDIVEIKNRFEFANLSLKIQEFNERALNQFNKKIEDETDIYFKDKKRKLAHLERYEDLETSFLTFESRKVSRINYNFYCVKEIPKVIDTIYLPAYHQLISGFAEEFFTVANRYGRRWNKKDIVS